VTPEKAFAEYRKTRPTFDVKPAFVDGWRMGREATIEEVLSAINEIQHAVSVYHQDGHVETFVARLTTMEAVRVLLESDNG
jgi:hypothetical protein